MTAGPERWLPVPGYEGLYEVSDLGQVRSLPRPTKRGIRGGNVLKHVSSGYGYPVVCIRKNGRGTMRAGPWRASRMRSE